MHFTVMDHLELSGIPEWIMRLRLVKLCLRVHKLARVTLMLGQ